MLASKLKRCLCVCKCLSFSILFVMLNSSECGPNLDDRLNSFSLLCLFVCPKVHLLTQEPNFWGEGSLGHDKKNVNKKRENENFEKQKNAFHVPRITQPKY